VKQAEGALPLAALFSGLSSALKQRGLLAATQPHMMYAGSTFSTACEAAWRPSRKGSPAALTAARAVGGTLMYAACRLT
jgi:hypothetical protein